MSLAVASAVLLVTTVMNVEAESLPYYDPPSPLLPSYSYAFKGASSILREKGEKLLLINADQPTYRAQSVIVLVNKEYWRVREEIRALVAETTGIREEQDNATSPIPKPKRERPPYIGEDVFEWPELGDDLMYLATSTHSPAIHEYQLTSRPYNRVASLNGFSEVRIRVSDAKTVFGQPMTILQVRRSDFSREWARTDSLHGLFPLPFKEDRAFFALVTNTEVSLIEKLKERIPDPVLRYFVALDLRSSKDYRETFRARMQEAVK